jgi:hypothetical protein
LLPGAERSDGTGLSAFDFFNLFRCERRLYFGERPGAENRHFDFATVCGRGFLTNDILIKFLADTGIDEFLPRDAELGLQFLHAPALAAHGGFVGSALLIIEGADGSAQSQAGDTGSLP